jgi:hypothetical protein
MADERHEFLANNIASVCDVSDRKAVTRSIEASPDVRDFLDDTKYVVVYLLVVRSALHCLLLTTLLCSLVFQTVCA